jgi:hypothetical protein
VMDSQIGPWEDDLQVGGGGARSGAPEGHRFGVPRANQGYG